MSILPADRCNSDALITTFLDILITLLPGSRVSRKLATAVMSPWLNPPTTMMTPTIDIYFIHGLSLAFYEASRERFLPVLQAAKQDGKIRFFGLTEAFESDTRHRMLLRALQDDDWDVLMIGFNLLNPSARQYVLAQTRQKGIGTLDMFAVRRALIDETWLRSLLQRLAENGEINPVLAAAPDLLESLGLQGSCESLSEAAYRFAPTSLVWTAS